MSYKLDPRIVSKLRAFAERRRKLIIIRGIATAAGMLLATMLLVAAIDFLFVLPDGVRWTLSGVAYLAVIIAEWRTCLRLLAHAPGPRKLARLVEHAEPKLREDLLSAVELGTPEGEQVLDSPRFRELLQEDVASRMDSMEMEQLLPVNLVRRYIFIAGGIAAAVIALFIITGFQLGTLMLRALIPGMNLARVSKTKVEVLGPNPAEMVVPFGDAVPLLVKISGVSAREAWMETFTEKEGRQKVKLTAVGEDQFAGTIQVGREDLRYRIRAGDAITQKYLLDAEPRPYVVKFTKTYHLPPYTKAEPRTVTEENGDLIALEGSEVDLSIETSQPIKIAELRLDQGRKSFAVPLTADAHGRLVAKVALSASGSYRVHLVGASTGFENKFSPEYELRAEPDLVPQIEIDQPKNDLILPANELVDLVGHATDDQGIARIEQHVRINDGGWKKVQLAGESGLKTSVSRRWDLYEQGAKAGDMITTKLVAFDLKGSRGESRPLQINVIASGVEMKRLESLESLTLLNDALRSWRESAEALAKASSDTRQRFEGAAANDPQRGAALTNLSAAYTDFERAQGDAGTALGTALRGSSPGHQGADLVLLGRVLAKIETTIARNAKTAALVCAADPSAAFARDLVRDADDAAHRSADRARVLESNFRTLLAGEEIDLVAENAQVISHEQQRIADLARASGEDAAKWAQLGNRIRVVLAETKGLEEVFARLGDRGVPGMDRAKNIAKELKKAREAVDKVSTEKGMTKDLLAPTLNLAEVVEKTEKSVLDLRAAIARRPLEMVKQMRAEAGTTWSNFERLLAELDNATNNSALSDAARSTLKDGRWGMRRDFFKTHGDIEEIRPTSDAFFVADLRSTTVAIEGIRALSASVDPKVTRAGISTLDTSFRILEAAHDLQEMLDGFVFLAAGERWQVATPRARTAAPRDWNWLEMRMRQVPDELVKLGLKDETVRKTIFEAQKIIVEAVRAPEFHTADEEMNERRKPDHAAVTARVEIESTSKEVKRALDLLRPYADLARQEIEKLTPKLSELAKALAKEAEDAKEETHKQEEATKDKTPEQAKADAEKALAKQEDLNQKVESLKDLLRADANKQDMIQAEQRDRARDADDALAMLKEPPPKAANALKDATKAETKSAQEQALAQASEQQQKLGQALNQIAQHYDALEKGEANPDTRTAMRAAEQELGVKDMLDQQYAKAQQLAQMAQASPQELLKQLEKALPQNPQMQQELSSISQATLNQAEEKLNAAAQAEQQVARNLDDIAKQPQQNAQPQSPNASPTQQAAMNAEQAARQAAEAAQAARKAADEAVQTAKQANNQNAANQARQARAEAEQATQSANQAAEAARQMAQASQPQQAAQAAQAAQQAAQKAGEAAQNAREGAQAAKQAQDTAQQSAQQGQQQAQNQQTAKEAGEAVQAAEKAAQAAMNAQTAAQQAAAVAQLAAQQNQQMAQQNAQPNAQAQQPAQAQASNAEQGSQPMPQANPQLAQAAQQQQPIAQVAGEAGSDVARAGRHEERLQNMQTGQQLQQLGAEIAETAMNEVPAAQQALAQAQQAAQAKQPVQAAAQELAGEASQLAQAAQGGRPMPQPQQQPNAQAAAQPNAQQAAQQTQQGTPAQNAQAQDQAQAQAQAQAAAAQPQGSTPPASPQQTPSAQQGQMAAAPATPQEQVWMARTLDALDAALNAPAQGTQSAQSQQGQPDPQGQQQGQQQAQQGQQGQPQQGQGQPQPNQSSQAQAMAQAQSAMQQAAQAAQRSMQQSRSQAVSPTPQGYVAQGDVQEKSEGGMNAQAPELAYGATPDAKNLKTGDWGKLPKKMAEQLSRGQGEAVAADYRQQVETYYRVIAEKAKK